MTEYNDYAILITSDKNLGNTLAAIAASFPNDLGAEQGTFDDSRKLVPEAWYAIIPCKQSFANAILALDQEVDISDERFAYLVQRGLDAQTLSLARSIFQDVLIFQKVVDSEALDIFNNFISSRGYSILQEEL